MTTKKTVTVKNKAAKPTAWKKIHEGLNNEQKATAKAKAMQACEFSEATFYAKMAQSDKLKFFQKNAIATAYGLPVLKMFPERKRRKTKTPAAV